jgi:hypothetical protein
MSQHDYQMDNAAGAVFRADLNSVLQAIASCNAGATEPAVTFPNMLWFDTSTGILKQRTNADDGWDEVALNSTDTDGTLAANSDSKIATQKATKTYADTKISKSTAGEVNALTEKTTPVDNDIVLIEDSAASYAKKKLKKSNLLAPASLGSGTPSSANFLRGDGAWSALSIPVTTVMEWHGYYIQSINYGWNVNGTAIDKIFWFASTVQTGYAQVFNTKFYKTAGINTLKFYINYQNAAGSGIGYGELYVGGLTSEVSKNGTGYEWLTNTLDVSSLTDGQIYDVYFYLKSDGTSQPRVYDFIVFGY